MVDTIFDVVQIGYGPVGQVLAAQLGKRGRSVAVYERHPSLYALPRAGHFDHEIMRIFQSLGAAEEIERDAFPATKYQWRNAQGELLISFDWDQVGVSGWMSDYLMYQPHMENALHRAVGDCASVSVNHGWEAIDITQYSDYVAVTFIQVATGERRIVKGRYLVGADGANSFVRQHLQLPWADLGFNESWVVLDFKQLRPLQFEFDNGQLCDPKRPLCLFQLGKSHRRFEYMVMPGESRDELLTPEHAWRVIEPWITPDDAQLIRQVIYTFKSGLAERWSEGRTFLVGDAAHLMPPFLGQGMCSGVRDAMNLAWKLDLVLADKVDERLLESYQLERSPHVKSIIDLAVQVGRVSCMVDPAEVAQRDKAFRDGDVPPPAPFPPLNCGLIDQGAQAHPMAGQLGPQGRLQRDWTIQRSDDLHGIGWQLIADFDAWNAISAASRALLEHLSVQVIQPVAVGTGCAGEVVDVDGTYRDYFAQQQLRAVLVRPDFYSFGGASEPAALDALIGRLGVALGQPVNGR
jgi:2-polyprenyl-6-methoxyphenol hydroxylase-like FAD-dependent oxidoreductase